MPSKIVSGSLCRFRDSLEKTSGLGALLFFLVLIMPSISVKVMFLSSRLFVVSDILGSFSNECEYQVCSSILLYFVLKRSW